MFENSVSGRRCLTYIAARAKLEGFEYSLEETDMNRDLLCELWDACLGFDADDRRYTKERLAALCDDLIALSMVSTLQGIKHSQPPSIEPYQRLFNTSSATLRMVDTPYTVPRPVSLQIAWEVHSDDDSVLKLVPGAQLKLPGFGVEESSEQQSVNIR